MSDEPELRDAPPWVMEDMIGAEADLPSRIAAEPGAARLGERLRAAAAAGEPILLTGCGTSEHAALAGAAILAEALPGAAVAARDAFEARLDPPAGGLVIAISHDGGTRSTLEAARRAQAAGAEALLVTARPEAAPDDLEAIATPLRDRSWCHTVGYLSPLLTVALGTGALAAGEAEAVIAAATAARDEHRAGAARLAGCRNLLIVGSGVDEITARELALKIEEAAYVPSTPLGAEKVLHGHLPAAGADTGVVLLRFDPLHAEERDRRAASVRAATAELGMPLVALAAPDPAGSRAAALLAGALALQLLTLELAHAHGTNPDRIRREQEPYRRAAEAGAVG